MTPMTSPLDNEPLAEAVRESLARALASGVNFPLLEAANLLLQAIADDPAVADLLDVGSVSELAQLLELEIEEADTVFRSMHQAPRDASAG